MSSISNGITSAATTATKIESATDGASFMSQMQDVQSKMQQNMVDKAELDANNAEMNNYADSSSKAASAAAQVKIQY
ncbi:hypothetical protein [Erwinia sp. 198]|jgi:hypothetical protein|uniref:hypothetical protein n=1 Tax=Erwinia sp. 198 TaxID=2022746 RepID=UPI000F67544B|nr:hypothetical protein [Erwinia sp. 198]RRZ93727.1 hypothetical protein EGK14_08005 [Erwinia sp. 198]